ncbi:hypothetical protein RQP46_004937 [Phenoliferia psychrophenolica]
MSPAKVSPEDRLAFLLVALIGSRVVATVKGGAQFTGILASATTEGELAVALRQANPLEDPTATPTPSLVILAKDLTQLHAHDLALDALASSVSSRAQDSRDGFRTDTDISGLPGEGRREKELQAWGGGGGAGGAGGGLGGLESGGLGQWDQFATNEKLYGARTDYHEDIYTTKLDRSGSDYSAKEKRAAQLEREIMKGTGSSSLANNAHMAEERGGIDDSGLTEEDRYGSVIRGPDAYVPPGARKGPLSRFNNTSGPPSSPSNGSSTSSSPAPHASTPPFLPRISEPSPTSTTTPTAQQPRTATPPTLESNFRSFVTSEKVRLTQKREQIVKTAERKDQDSRLASLLEFSQSFKLKTPMPDDMASIGRDNTKKPSSSTVTSPVQSPLRPAARALTPATPTAGAGKSASTRSSPTAARIAEIPPFKPKVAASAGSTPVLASARMPSLTASTPAPATPALAAATASTPLKPPTASTSKINPHAPVFVFKPNPNASAFTPSFAASPSRKPAELPAAPLNPFFGNKVIKKSSPSMHVKEDFTPFKNGVVPESTTVPQAWPFTGKSYKSMFPDTRMQGDETNDMPAPQQQLPPHLAQGGVPMHPLHSGGPPPPQGYYQQYQPAFNRFPPPPQQQPQQAPMQHMQQPPMNNSNGGNLQYSAYPPMGFPQQGPPHGGPMYAPSPQMQPQQQQPFMRYAPFPPGQPNGVPLGFQGQGDPRPMAGP